MDGARMPSAWPRRRMVSASRPSLSSSSRAAAMICAARAGSSRGSGRRAIRRSRSGDGFELEHRVLVSDAADLLIGGVRADAVEEDAHLCLPAPQVGAQHWDLGVAGQLLAAVVLALAAKQQIQPAFVGPDVAHPLGFAPGGDQVLASIE